MRVSGINSETSFKAQPLRPQASAVKTAVKDAKDTVSFAAGKTGLAGKSLKSFAGIAAAVLATAFILTSGKDKADKAE